MDNFKEIAEELKNINRTCRIPIYTVDGELEEVIAKDQKDVEKYIPITQNNNWDRFLKRDRISIPSVDEDFDYKR